MIPVFSIVGSRSNVGKTKVICDIIMELKERGYRVGTIKHDVHGFEIDHPGKDTWLHSQAGADLVSISSKNKMAIIEKLEEEYTLDEMIEKIDNVDIIITEGYKSEKRLKLEVFRKEVADHLISKDEELFAIVTDKNFNKDIPQFDFKETSKLVDLIEDRFLLKR